MEPIELTIETASGVADVNMELQEDVDEPYWQITILLPIRVNGFMKSEVICCDMRFRERRWVLDPPGQELHPAILEMEPRLSDAITKKGMF